MTEYEEITQRLTASITRISDRLTVTDEHQDDLRANFIRIFEQCILGREAEPIFYGSLPFPVALLTDPHLFHIPGGLLVLDHPTHYGRFESIFHSHRRVHIVDLPLKWSLYENRFPRLILCVRKGDESPSPSFFSSRLSSAAFYGPFYKSCEEI